MSKEKINFVASYFNKWRKQDMGDIINISSIHDYNEFLGIETLNPLVTFIDFKDVKVLKHKRNFTASTAST